MPTSNQLESLYRISYELTYKMFQPIHLVGIDARTRNLFVLAGYDDGIEIQIAPMGG